MTAIPDSATNNHLASLCSVTSRTVRRWRASSAMPKALAAWVMVATTGDLSVLDARWKGWRLSGGTLLGPDLANGFSPADILSIPYIRAQVKNYQREQRFPRQADAFSGLYAPVIDAPPLPLRNADVLALPGQPERDRKQA